MRAVKVFFLFCVAVFSTSSGAAYGQDVTDEKAATPVKTEANPLPTPETENPYAKSNDRYRIGFQDELAIEVYRQKDLSQPKINVNPDGTIMLPRMSRPIVAVCRTERELADAIAAQYKTFLKDPFVNVRATEQRSQPFAVVGAVQKPNSFYLNRRIRLLELLAFAGGPDVNKAGSKVQVARVGNLTGCAGNEEGEPDKEVEFTSYNLNEVLKGKENPWMQPGDIVSVLIAEEAYVVGNVLKPSKIILRETRTLTQAIAEAGGLNSTAKTDKVIIQRQAPGTTTKTETAYNLKDIRSQKIPDPEIQANDIVVVGNDNLKSIRKGLIDVFKTAAPIILY